MKKIESNLYAVYGTLKKGHGNHRILNNKYCEYKGVTKTAPEYSLYHLGGFPGIKENGETAVEIEVYEVSDPNVESDLDRLEGYAPDREHNFYNKIEIDTKFGKAFLYIYNHEINPKNFIKDGKW